MLLSLIGRYLPFQVSSALLFMPLKSSASYRRSAHTLLTRSMEQPKIDPPRALQPHRFTHVRSLHPFVCHYTIEKLLTHHARRRFKRDAASKSPVCRARTARTSSCSRGFTAEPPTSMMLSHISGSGKIPRISTTRPCSPSRSTASKSSAVPELSQDRTTLPSIKMSTVRTLSAPLYSTERDRVGGKEAKSRGGDPCQCFMLALRYAMAMSLWPILGSLQIREEQRLSPRPSQACFHACGGEWAPNDRAARPISPETFRELDSFGPESCPAHVLDTCELPMSTHSVPTLRIISRVSYLPLPVLLQAGPCISSVREAR